MTSTEAELLKALKEILDKCQKVKFNDLTSAYSAIGYVQAVAEHAIKTTGDKGNE